MTDKPAPPIGKLVRDIVLLLAFIVPVGYYLAWSWGQDEPKAEAAPDPGAWARQACREAIRQTLHDPGSAEWGALHPGYFGNWATTVTGDGHHVVVADFRAKNAFGALVRTQIRCVVDVPGKKLVDLQQL